MGVNFSYSKQCILYFHLHSMYKQMEMVLLEEIPVQTSTTAGILMQFIRSNAVNWGLHVVNKHSAGIGAKIENTNASSVNDALQVGSRHRACTSLHRDSPQDSRW